MATKSRPPRQHSMRPRPPLPKPMPILSTTSTPRLSFGGNGSCLVKARGGSFPLDAIDLHPHSRRIEGHAEVFEDRPRHAIFSRIGDPVVSAARRALPPPPAPISARQFEPETVAGRRRGWMRAAWWPPRQLSIRSPLPPAAPKADADSFDNVDTPAFLRRERELLSQGLFSILKNPRTP